MTSFGDYAMSYQSKLSEAANFEAWKFWNEKHFDVRDVLTFSLT
jgi:hypothetical protein